MTSIKNDKDCSSRVHAIVAISPRTVLDLLKIFPMDGTKLSRFPIVKMSKTHRLRNGFCRRRDVAPWKRR